mgnify:FL=1|jgi:hypothetical protein|tara:strand:+ start:80 stop:328 length:249 start_codon:yes stop_codon:yes gene_type:complete
MSNSTLITSGNEMDYIAISGWALFLISEVMPFLKKKESFNGLIHTATCMLRGSKCFIDKALEVAESNMERGEEKTGEVSQKE